MYDNQKEASWPQAAVKIGVHTRYAVVSRIVNLRQDEDYHITRFFYAAQDDVGR